MKIESSDRTVDQLLKANTFVIPRFQRAYSWEQDQILQFWQDIIDNLGQPYFIGSMVVYELDRSSVAVVDGQQRLTTITILLCAIRDAYNALEKSDLAEGLQAYIEQKNRENQTEYVLKTETSFPYLQEEVLKNGPSESIAEIGHEELAIERAFNLFKENISENVNKLLDNKEQ